MSSRRLFISSILSCLLFGLFAPAQESGPIFDYDSLFHPVVGKKGMVTSQEVLASQVGLDVLKQGGNAVDAAVAVGYALAVTLPKAGNLGGGGFMLVYLAGENKTVAINFREMAPAGAHRDMYLDENGEVDKNKARFSYHSVGVPGTVAGMSYALDKYGTMSLKKLLKPAAALARKGILVTYSLSADITRVRKRFEKCDATRAIFLRPDGTPWQPGEILVQKDLAWSLKQIARKGPDAFYKGKIGQRLAADMAEHGGLINMQDLAAYRVTESEPVWGEYRGHKIASMPPPSSGGVHVIQMLNILEGFPVAEMGHNSAAGLHLLAETMKPAYADRSKYLGDPDFYDVPVSGLISKDYADELRKKISQETARPSTDIGPADPLPYESTETTHYSVVDQYGNAVAVTYTLNFSFGTSLVAAGTGILLNNEMDDFSSKPGSPNAFGLLGGEANAIQPGKRPLSSMTPTMVFKDGKPMLITGSPGGSTIITAVLQIILNVVDHKMNIAEAACTPRMHHQWLPDKLRLEKGISVDTLRLLESMGHKVERTDTMGSTQSILLKDGKMFGASDPRRPGAGAAAW
ncbi:MAG: gamma-glutamyltransferase [Acidobacteriota bacterium]|nr:gamma-glutamyltransferase [Acidobacteriota bacterium]